MRIMIPRIQASADHDAREEVGDKYSRYPRVVELHLAVQRNWIRDPKGRLLSNAPHSKPVAEGSARNLAGSEPYGGARTRGQRVDSLAVSLRSPM